MDTLAMRAGVCALSLVGSGATLGATLAFEDAARPLLDQQTEPMAGVLYVTPDCCTAPTMQEAATKASVLDEVPTFVHPVIRSFDPAEVLDQQQVPEVEFFATEAEDALIATLSMR